MISARERWQFNALWLLGHVMGSDRLERAQHCWRSDKRRSELERPPSRPPGAAKLRPVRAITDPGGSAFRRRYLTRVEPVVLRAAARGWPCCSRWTPEFFAAEYGDREQVLIPHSPPEISRNKRQQEQVERSSMGQVVADIDQGAYANFNPLLNYAPELRADLDMAWLDAHRDRLGVNQLFQLFMGGAGVGTGLHSAISSNLFVQIHGRKRWVLFSPDCNPVLDVALSREPCFHSPIDAMSPDYEAHPAFQNVVGYEVVLEPGDVLYNPPFFWHQTVNVTRSIGVSYKWSYLPSFVRASGMQSLLTFLSTNPPVWKALGSGDKYMSIYTHGRPSVAPIAAPSAPSAPSVPSAKVHP